jgi:hypothetical protein
VYEKPEQADAYHEQAREIDGRDPAILDIQPPKGAATRIARNGLVDQ